LQEIGRRRAAGQGHIKKIKRKEKKKKEKKRKEKKIVLSCHLLYAKKINESNLSIRVKPKKKQNKTKTALALGIFFSLFVSSREIQSGTLRLVCF